MNHKLVFTSLKKLSVAMMMVPVVGYANTNIIVNDKVNEPSLIENKDITKIQNNIKKQVPSALPSENNKSTQKRMTKQESLEYFKKNTEELEFLLAHKVKATQVDEIEDLLPIYIKYHPNVDKALVLWCNALIDQKNGDYNKANNTFKNLVTRLPHVRILRFHYAVSLLRNNLPIKAKEQLLLLKNNPNIKKQDLLVINDILTNIEEGDKWQFSANASYTQSDNLTNSPKQGTVYYIGGSNRKLAGGSAGARESGKGVRYGVSANKRYSMSDNRFNLLSLSLYGTHYYNNKKFNNIAANITGTFGYQKDKSKVTFSPYLEKELYGGGSAATTGKLRSYRTKLGFTIGNEYKISDKLMFMNSVDVGSNTYVELFKNNNSKDLSINNQLVYNISNTAYVYGGVNYFNRKGYRKISSYDRIGVSTGWGQLWPLGFNTRMNLGYGWKKYFHADLFNNVRKNQDFSGRVSFWNKYIALFGFMPRVNVSYRNTESNTNYEELSDSSVYVDFTKDF